MEVNDAVRKRVFDPRKVSAYESWGILSKVGNRLVLSALGTEFAAIITQETEIYRAMLHRTRPYHSALVWMDQLGRELVTYQEVGAVWRQHHPEAIDGEGAEAHAISFFHLCHAAEIGLATAGRKGQPTRLRIYLDELRACLGDVQDDLQGREFRNGNAVLNKASSGDPNGQAVEHRAVGAPIEDARVFVSYSKNEALVSRLREAFDLADVEGQFIERRPGSLTPLSDRTLDAMRRCQAGIFVLSEDFAQSNAEMIEEHVMVEIGAAFVHFDKRVMLLAEKKISLPPNLHDLDCYEFDGDLPGWEVLIQLTKAVKFLSRAGSVAGSLLARRPEENHETQQRFKGTRLISIG
jgi:hypothetical protein